MFSEMKILTYWHVYNINIIKSLKTIPPSGGSQIYQATVDDEKCLDCAGLGWWWLVGLLTGCGLTSPVCHTVSRPRAKTRLRTRAVRGRRVSLFYTSSS